MSSVDCCERSRISSASGRSSAAPLRTPCSVWIWPSAIARLLLGYESSTTAVARHSFDLQADRRHPIELEQDQRFARAQIPARSAAVKEGPRGIDEEPTRLGDADRRHRQLVAQPHD